MLLKLPSAFFSGVSIIYADEEKATVSIPFKWFNRNPFGSTYFACLSMAAEMSTGILAMVHTYKIHPQIQLIVTKTEATFHKKARGKTIFTCNDGPMLNQVINEVLSSGKTASIMCSSNGVSESGELIADFQITWNFRIKPNH